MQLDQLSKNRKNYKGKGENKVRTQRKRDEL